VNSFVNQPDLRRLSQERIEDARAGRVRCAAEALHRPADIRLAEPIAAVVEGLRADDRQQRSIH
jgi:hypothetical protein